MRRLENLVIYLWWRATYWMTRDPFLIKGHHLWYCFHCAGWGNEPSTGGCCAYCMGAGWKTISELECLR